VAEGSAIWPNTSFAGLSSADAVSICNCSAETTEIASMAALKTLDDPAVI
jgi:hypothetical protein